MATTKLFTTHIGDLKTSSEEIRKRIKDKEKDLEIRKGWVEEFETDLAGLKELLLKVEEMENREPEI